LVGGLEVGQELRLAAGERCDRQAVAIDDAIGGQRREPLARRQYADQVERIGARERDPLAGGRAAAHLAHEADGLRQRELLARETGDETAAANFAARFEPSVD